MVKAKLSQRVRKLQNGDEHIALEHDPEANGPDSPQASDSEASDDENAGTEHYVTVGKSKLRQKEGVALGPQYRGSRVSREALENESEEEDDEDDEEEDEEDEEEEYANPDLIDLEADEAEASDSEIDSDDALAESDAERLEGFVFRGSSKPVDTNGRIKKRATAADFMSSDEEEGRGGAHLKGDKDGDDEDDEEEDEDEDEEDGLDGADLDDSDEDEDMDDGLDDLVNGGADSEDDISPDDSEEDGSAEEADEQEESDEDDNEHSTRANDKDAKPMMGTLSNTADVDKGIAIQQQRKAYDGMLNLRIRLQKALVAANTLPTMDSTSDDSDSEPYHAAEEAAVKLLNTISSLQGHFTPSAKAGNKRKRGFDSDMTSEEIWSQLQEEDQKMSKSRDDRLDKWWRKVQSVTVTTTARGLGARNNKSLIDALQDQLADPESRLVKRTRVPRSCAPAQAGKGITTDAHIYDDADFYQLLLKELVDQRTVESAQASNDGGPNGVPSLMLTAARDAKTRKNVDRKASKGRKMRFTVHEKLQNFMAPEDRRTWEQGAIERFFGALFGRKLELDENEDEESGGDGDEDMSDAAEAEEQGLRLFRN